MYLLSTDLKPSRERFSGSCSPCFCTSAKGQLLPTVSWPLPAAGHAAAILLATSEAASAKKEIFIVVSYERKTEHTMQKKNGQPVCDAYRRMDCDGIANGSGAAKIQLREK